jgi:hypothetical protein
MYTIDFLGLIYFYNLGDEGRLVMLPDGRVPPPNVQPHSASFFIEESNIVAEPNWWQANPNQKLKSIHVVEFPIPEPSQITISGMEPAAGNAGCWPFKPKFDGTGLTKLNNLNKIDPELDITPEYARTIAQMPIRRGKLESFLFGGGDEEDSPDAAAVARLTVNGHSGPVTITARTTKGMEKTFTVKNGTEIILSNTSDLFAPHEGKSHFRLYGRLDKNGKDDKLDPPPDAPSGLRELDSTHPYLLALDGVANLGEPGCSVTCC